MDFLTATVYGIIQGLCEFLPISSSGHLALLPLFMSIDDPGVFFDLLMHVGTALALCVYFRRDVGQILLSCFDMVRLFLKNGRWRPSNHADFLMVNMLVATITSVMLIVLLKDYAESLGRNYSLIAFNLIFFGFLLWGIDWLVKRKEDHRFHHMMDFKSAILIGLSQALAIFPGVSRSGITITMARVLGMSKTSGASFSFLLSLPIIFAGAALKIVEVSQTGVSIPPMGITIYATLLSAAVGYITIHTFLKLIKNFPFIYFFLYRIAIGVFVIYLL